MPIVIPTGIELVLSLIGTFVLLAGPLVIFLVGGNSKFMQNFVEKMIDNDMKNGKLDWKLKQNGNLPPVGDENKKMMNDEKEEKKVK